MPIAVHFLKPDGSHVRIPGDRDADGVEAGLLEHAEKCPRSDGLSPGGLIIRRRRDGKGTLDPHVVHVPAVGVQRVPEVPAGAHLPDRIGGTFPEGRLRLLPSGLRDRDRPGQRPRLNGHGSRPAFEGVVGLHGEVDRHLVVGEGAHGLGPDPVRTGRHVRAGRSRNLQGDGLPGLGDVEDVTAQGDGARCEGCIFPAGGDHPQDSQEDQGPFHHFNDGICSRVRTRLEDIRLCQ